MNDHAARDEPSVRHTRVGNWTITTVMTGGPWRENCHIVSSAMSSDGVIIDPGAQAETIIRETRRVGIAVHAVLLTHAHHDHVGAVAEVCREFGVVCRLSPLDAKLLRQAALYAYRFGGRKIENPEPLETFASNEFHFGPHQVHIRPTPGHTPGGVVFHMEGFAFTGDTLLYQHIGRTDMPGGKSEVLRSSIDALLAETDAATILFAGHGREWTVSEARAWWATVGEGAPPHDSYAPLA